MDISYLANSHILSLSFCHADIRKLKKKDLGLPYIDDATEEQKTTGMCWEKDDELYNNGTPFKITLRDKRGIMVTILADNYFGYCKKEVKTQVNVSIILSTTV